MGKILSWNELKVHREALRKEGKKTVFTNGCFDIVHVGHIRYLSEAKALGDVLIVAVNSDLSVGRLKHGRPVVPESQRAEVVSHLDMVDYVTLFSEDTPYDLIRLIEPDVLVKGGDWRREDIVGSDIVPETYSLPYVGGVSTTGIIEKIEALLKSRGTTKGKRSSTP